MIIFKRIWWRNLLSTGNIPVEIKLNSTNTTLISGKNGTGKSTILDALIFGLYGKPFRKINKPQLLNSINNSDLEVGVEFSIGEDNYKIIRGMRPAKFEIFVNDVLLPQDSSIKDYQKILEEQILKINYTSFIQIVILGSSSYIPFMRLPAHNRRNIIENILDISIFSLMLSVLKDRNIDLLKSNMEKEKIKTISENEFSMKLKMMERGRQDIEKRRKDILNKIIRESGRQETLQNTVAKYNNLGDKIKLAKKKKKGYEKELLKFNNYRIKINQNNKRIDAKIKFYIENDICPDCDQNIEDHHKENKIKDLESRRDSFAKGLKDLDEKINSIKEFIETSHQEIKILDKHWLNYNKAVSLLEMVNTSIESFNDELENLEKEESVITQQELDALQEKILEYTDALEEDEKIKKYYSIIQSLLKDDGIKTKIIKYYLPVINKTVNKYLEKLNFIVNFTFDENFNEKILSRNRDQFSYFSFSEGEKNRIDLSLLFTWREVAKRKNSVATNLLFLDEVFDSSLDVDGTDAFETLLSEESKNSNIFVITHSPAILMGKFDRHISVEKEGNFSKYEIIT